MSTQARDLRDQAGASPQPKLGAGALGAMGRLGLHELRSVVQAFPDSNVVQPTEMGVLGTKSAQEVVDERRRDLMPGAEPERELQQPGPPASSSPLDAHLARARDAVGQGRESRRGPEPERDGLERDRE
ncbi:MAG: hypothetical protein U0638_12700 [Phycisphaerales bacterium]